MKRVRTKRAGKSGVEREPSPTVRLPSGPDAIRRQRIQLIAVCTLLAAAILFVFRQTTEFDFVNYDDDANIYGNPIVSRGLTLAGVAWAFTHSQVGLWIPVTTLSHMLDCQAYGLSAGGHHLTNVILHTASAILLFLVLHRMTSTLWPSAFVAALFAVHPLRVESVAWVTERKDVLSGLFFVLTIAAYVGYARRPASLRRYLLVMLMFALGLMSKSMLVTLPFVLLLLDYWPLGRFGTPAGGSPVTVLRNPDGRAPGPLRLIGEKLPLLALSAIASVVAWKSNSPAIVSLEILSFPARIGNALASYVDYICQMVYPAGLAALYPHLGNGLPLGKTAAASAVLIVISAIAIGMRRREPWLLVGWLWYLGMLVPVIGIVQSGGIARADRYTYLPQIGLSVAIAWTAVDLARTIPRVRGLIAAIGIAVIPVLAVCARVQAGYWKDAETVWKRALSCTEGNTIAHNNLGNALSRQGRQDEAIAEWQRALTIRPTNPDTRRSLACALVAEGRLAEAVTHFKILLRIQPLAANTHTDLGIALLGLGKPDEARAHFEKSLSLDGTSVKTLDTLAWLLATCQQDNLRDGRRAVELAQKADQLSESKNPMVIDTLAAAYAEAGHFPEAIQTARRALQRAGPSENTQLADDIRARIRLYEGNHPFREVPSLPKTAPKEGQ
jgi:Flp pilus assembly protein TadD